MNCNNWNSHFHDLVRNWACALLILSIGWKYSTAGEKYQVNFMLAPSYETMKFRNLKTVSPFDYKFSYNFGAEYKYFLDARWTLAAGVQFNNRGFSSHPVYQTTDSLVIESDDAVIYISTKYVTVPINLSFNFQPFFRTEIFASTGIGLGVLVDQSAVGRRIPAEVGTSTTLFNNFGNEREKISWFDRTYASWNAGVGVSRYVKSRLVITIGAMYYRQIDRAVNLAGPLVLNGVDKNGSPVIISPKFDSFAIECKLGWYFSDQIENKKKDL